MIIPLLVDDSRHQDDVAPIAAHRRVEAVPPDLPSWRHRLPTARLVVEVFLHDLDVLRLPRPGDAARDYHLRAYRGGSGFIFFGAVEARQRDGCHALRMRRHAARIVSVK